MPKKKINGIDLYYEIHGRGDPLVLIMGLRRNAEWWYRQIPFLSSHFKVLAFDNRGAGRSDQPAMEYSIRLFAEDTALLMQALEIEKAHILGISMGGYIAQELAIRFPEKVRGLILGCTSAGGPTAVRMSPERLAKFIANEGLSPEAILKKDMDIYFSDRYLRENPEEIEEFIASSLRHYQPADAFQRQLDACLRHDTAGRLNRIQAPTLILTGDDDPLIPPDNSRQLEALLSRASLELFPGLRHCFFLEDWKSFNQKVWVFLKSVP